MTKLNKELIGMAFMTFMVGITCLRAEPLQNSTSKLTIPIERKFNMQPLSPITSKESPREILATDFKKHYHELPIRGGWGYTKEDACIIDKNDPIVDTSSPFDGVSVEYTFAELRTYEEMIIFRPEGEKFSEIRWDLLEQSTMHDNGHQYDVLVFNITAIPDKEWKKLKAEFEGPNGYSHPGFDFEEHMRKRQEKMVTFKREFWFDITSYYGKEELIFNRKTDNKIELEQDTNEFIERMKKHLIDD